MDVLYNLVIDPTCTFEITATVIWNLVMAMHFHIYFIFYSIYIYIYIPTLSRNAALKFHG